VNIKQGYKQTEIGVIPEDWEVKNLNEICKPSSTRINPLTANEDKKCVELEHLEQATGKLIGFADLKDLKSQKAIFEKNDVLFSKLRPYLRKFLFAEFNGACTTEIWVLKAEKEIESKWLYYLIQSDRIIEAANQSTGTKMPRAEWKTVGNTQISLPPKQEQTAIAAALSDVDALMGELDKLIATSNKPTCNSF
jgi:type I restriction enzyme S subunit